jgi:hypothetical protein
VVKEPAEAPGGPQEEVLPDSVDKFDGQVLASNNSFLQGAIV